MPVFDDDEIRGRKKRPCFSVGFRALNNPAMLPNQRMHAVYGLEEDTDISAALEEKGDFFGDQIADSVPDLSIGGEDGDPHPDPSVEDAGKS